MINKIWLSKWISAALLCGLYVNNYAYSAPKNQDCISAGGNITAKEGSIISCGSVTIGITLSEYEKRLKAREIDIEKRYKKEIEEKKELINKLISRNGKDDKEKVDLKEKEIQRLEIELQAARKQLENPQESYEKLAQLVKEQSIELEKYKNKFTDKELNAAKIALQNGDTSKAKELFKKIRDEAEAPIKQAAEAEYQLGRIEENNISYQKAYEHFQRAAQLQPKNANYNSYFGIIAETLGLYDEALRYAEIALKIKRSALGENHPSVAASLNNIGMTWFSKGSYDKALEYLEQALKIRRSILGENHPDVATSLNNIGLAWDS